MTEGMGLRVSPGAGECRVYDERTGGERGVFALGKVRREEDPAAFMIITSATEVYGEGYKSYFAEKL